MGPNTKHFTAPKAKIKARTLNKSDTDNKKLNENVNRSIYPTNSPTKNKDTPNIPHILHTSPLLEKTETLLPPLVNTIHEQLSYIITKKNNMHNENRGLLNNTKKNRGSPLPPITKTEAH